MSLGRIESVSVRVQPDDIDPRGNFSDDSEMEREFLEALENGNAGWDHLRVEVRYTLPGSEYVHEVGDSLGGVSTYSRTSKESQEARDYIRHELESMLGGLSKELRRHHVSVSPLKRLGEQAIEGAIDHNGSYTARNDEAARERAHADLRRE